MEVSMSTKEIKKYLKKYRFILEKVLSNYQLVTEKENQLLFQGEEKNHVIVEMKENDKKELIIQEVKNNYYREIKLPLQEQLNSSRITIEETITEEREKGIIVEKNKRTYKESYLTDLESTRYVISSENEIIALRSNKNLENTSEITTTFSIHTPCAITEENVSILGIVTPSIELNGVDISNVYERVVGKNKIDRIFDLYRGIITKDNLPDLYSIHLGMLTEYAYDYKEVAGVSVLEDELVGKKITTLTEKELLLMKEFLETKINYQGSFDLENRESLIDALKYRPTIKENVSQTLQRTIGMTYDEFDALDCDDQQAIIQEYHRKNPKPESEYVTVMIGSGEHAIFQKAKRGTKVLIGSGRNSCFVTVGKSKEELQESTQEEKTTLKQKVKSKLNHFFKR